MAANLWQVYSAVPPTTGAMARIATGATGTPKTVLQVTAGTTDLVVVSWGVTLETAPTAFVMAELINTTTVAGTGATTVTPSNLQGGTVTNATAGFGPSAEGTVVATTRTFDTNLMLSPSYEYEWSLGREPLLEAGQVLRVRLSSTVSVNALAWIVYE